MKRIAKCLLLFLLLANHARAEGILERSLHGAISTLAPVPDDTSYAVRRSAAELLSRYLKPQGGNLLSQQVVGGRTWIQTKGLKLGSVTARPVTPADQANGIEESYYATVDSQINCTYDSATSRWSPWRDGGYMMMPPAIEVQKRRGGTWTASSSYLDRMMMFSRQGNPDLIPHGAKPVPSSNPRMPTRAAIPPNLETLIPLRSHSLSEHVLSFFVFVAVVLFVGLAIVIWLGGSSFKGWIGETMVRRMILNRLDKTLYQIYGDIYLPRADGAGTTQIDHVVVSKFGIFVIETKNYKGWIFGSESQPQWTQQIFRKKSRFQNPLWQNLLHVKALKQFLAIPDDHFHPVVMFMGEAVFKTPMPSNVLNRGLLSWIQSKQDVLLDDQKVDSINQVLADHVKSTERRKASREHLQMLAQRGNIPDH